VGGKPFNKREGNLLLEGSTGALKCFELEQTTRREVRMVGTLPYHERRRGKRPTGSIDYGKKGNT